MNYKLLFASYRTRYLFVKETLEYWSGKRSFEKILNAGTGEGDYDALLTSYGRGVIAFDISESDIAFARKLNGPVKNIDYLVCDILQPSFPDNSFDLIISVDMLEHVKRPEKAMEEMGRILKPGGIAVITFPQSDFPFTLDPVNKILGYFTAKKIPQGAYAFGHKYLIPVEVFRSWAVKNHLKIVYEKNLSGYIVTFLEMYWTGILQRIFKANAYNTRRIKQSGFRPSIGEPALTWITDLIIRADRALCGKSSKSLGKGFVLIKETT